jgi:hypothetical protein
MIIAILLLGVTAYGQFPTMTNHVASTDLVIIAQGIWERGNAAYTNATRVPTNIPGEYVEQVALDAYNSRMSSLITRYSTNNIGLYLYNNPAITYSNLFPAWGIGDSTSKWTLALGTNGTQYSTNWGPLIASTSLTERYKVLYAMSNLVCLLPGTPDTTHRHVDSALIHIEVLWVSDLEDVDYWAGWKALDQPTSSWSQIMGAYTSYWRSSTDDFYYPDWGYTAYTATVYKAGESNRQAIMNPSVSIYVQYMTGTVGASESFSTKASYTSASKLVPWYWWFVIGGVTTEYSSMLRVDKLKAESYFDDSIKTINLTNYVSPFFLRVTNGSLWVNSGMGTYTPYHNFTQQVFLSIGGTNYGAADYTGISVNVLSTSATTNYTYCLGSADQPEVLGVPIVPTNDLDYWYGETNVGGEVYFLNAGATLYYQVVPGCIYTNWQGGVFTNTFNWCTNKFW